MNFFVWTCSIRELLYVTVFSEHTYTVAFGRITNLFTLPIYLAHFSSPFL